MVCSAACSTRTIKNAQERGDRHLNRADLEQLLPGSILTMTEYGTEAQVTLHPDGRASARNNENEKSGGTWKIAGEDQFCLAFQKWHFGEPKCYTVYERQGVYQQFSATGRQTGSFTIYAPGTVAAIATPALAASSPLAAAHPARPQNTSPRYPSQDTNHLIRKMAMDCPGCRFAGANLNGASLANADLTGTDLADSDLRHADLRRARLSRTNLRNANLADANLTGADLTAANLTGANLTGANLYQAILINAVLTNAQGADLRGAVVE